MKNFLQDKLWKPIVGQLKQGATPEKLAASAAVGVTVSLFPIFGMTTPLCLLAGILFRLNHIVIQSVNYLMTPLQIAALPVLIKLGERLFGIPPVSFNPAQIGSELMAAPMQTLSLYGKSSLAGICVWVLIAVPLFIVIQKIFTPLIRSQLKSETKETT